MMKAWGLFAGLVLAGCNDPPPPPDPPALDPPSATENVPDTDLQSLRRTFHTMRRDEARAVAVALDPHFIHEVTAADTAARQAIAELDTNRRPSDLAKARAAVQRLQIVLARQ